MRAASSLFLLLLLISAQAVAMPSSSRLTPVPISDDEKVLDLALRDILSNPEFQSVRDSKGTPGDQTAELYGWPPEFTPSIPGWIIRHGDRTTVPDPNTCRLLGIGLASFDRKAQSDEDYDDPCGGPIAITLFNVGGIKNGCTVIGAHYVFYDCPAEDGHRSIRYLNNCDF